MRTVLALLAGFMTCAAAIPTQGSMLVWHVATVSFASSDLFPTDSDQDNALTGGIASSTSGLATAKITSSPSSSQLLATFDLVRNGRESNVQGLSYVEFTATSNSSYTITGSFTNESGYALLHVTFYDQTTSGFLFDEAQRSFGSTPTTLTVGSPSADHLIFTLGLPTTGTLIAGHDYWFYAATSVLDENGHFGGGDSGAAGGSVRLTTSYAVPEPASSAAWAGIAISLGAIMGFRGKRIPSGSRA